MCVLVLHPLQPVHNQTDPKSRQHNTTVSTGRRMSCCVRTHAPHVNMRTRQAVLKSALQFSPPPNLNTRQPTNLLQAGHCCNTQLSQDALPPNSTLHSGAHACKPATAAQKPCSSMLLLLPGASKTGMYTLHGTHMRAAAPCCALLELHPSRYHCNPP